MSYIQEQKQKKSFMFCCSSDASNRNDLNLQRNKPMRKSMPQVQATTSWTDDIIQFYLKEAES